MDGGAPWWPEVAAWCGPARDGAGSRGGKPVAPSPPVSVSPGGETHRGAVGAAARTGGVEGGREWRPGEGEARGGVGARGGGIPRVSSAPGGAWMRPESVGDGAGAGAEYLLHHIMGWEQ